MRYTLIALGALVAATTANVVSSEAAQRPWCQRGGANGAGMFDCTYHTFQQCLASASGNNGSCVRNPNFRGNGNAYGEERGSRRQRSSNWNWN